MSDPMQDQQRGHLEAPLPPGQHDASPGHQAFGSAPMVEEEESWGKIGIVMVALAVLFAGGVAFFIATSGDDDLIAEAEPTSREPVMAMASAPDATPKASGSVIDARAVDAPDVGNADAGAIGDSRIVDAPDVGSAYARADSGAIGFLIGGDVDESAEPLRANGEVDRPAGLVSLTIESEPPGADVIRKADGVRLGKTPYLYEIESMPGTVDFVLQLDGYRSTSMNLPSDRDGVRQVMLLPGNGGTSMPALAPTE